MVIALRGKTDTEADIALPLRRRAAIWLISLAMVFVAIIAIVDVFFGFYVVSLVLAATAVWFGILLRHIVRGGDPAGALAAALLTGLGGLFLPAISHEPVESLLWCITYPPFFIFFFGMRRGLRWTAVLFVLLVAFMFFVNPSQIGVAAVGIVMAYLLVALTSFFYEQARLTAMAELETLMHTDVLTGVFNRRRLDALMEQELAHANENNGALSLLVIDIDDFKRVNDLFGHSGGDDLLRALANQVRGAAPSECHIARIGGDEFQVIVPQTLLETATELAETLRAGVAGAQWLDGCAITISVGVAEAQPGDSSRTLFRRADQALYEAKGLGKNRVRASLVATEAMSEGAPQEGSV